MDASDLTTIGMDSQGVPLRGGNWNNTSNAGFGYLNMNNERGNSNNNIGLALDYLLGRKRDTHGWHDSRKKKIRESIPSAR